MQGYTLFETKALAFLKDNSDTEQILEKNYESEVFNHSFKLNYLIIENNL